MAIVQITSDDDTTHGNRNPRVGRGGNPQIIHRASQVVSMQNPCASMSNCSSTKKENIPCFRIATWNVKTLYEPGKIYNAIKEMERLSVDIIGISEMRWTNTGHCQIKNHKVFYSGNTNEEHINGVGIIVNSKIAKSITNFIPVSERIIYVQLDSGPIKTNIIQVYAPTSDKSEETIELFYHDLISILRKLPKKDMTVIMGDFNAKIGSGRSGDMIGPFGLGERNERGDRLCSFAIEEQLVIANTFFKLPARRLYTWKSPQDNEAHVVRNQIDYIMINKRFRNAIAAVKAYPGADIKSDHNPLIGTIKLKLKMIKPAKTANRDLNMLKNETTKNAVCQHIQLKMEQIISSTSETEVENNLDSLNKIQQEAFDRHLGIERRKKKSWMTDEILDMMEIRRKLKDDKVGYGRLDRDIRKAIREAKNQWFLTQCREIELLEKKHDTFNLHKKVKEAAGLVRPRTPICLTDESGTAVVDKAVEKQMWMKYVEATFKDDRSMRPFNEKCTTGPFITTEEVRETIKKAKDGKATGPDNFHSEFLKLMNDEGIKWLTSIFNRIYDNGRIPQSWLKSTFITLPKKPNARKCNDHRIISLMSHVLKTFLKVIHKRITLKCETHLSRTQFGFRDALGTREALFAVQVLFQRCRDVNCPVYVCFIDYTKAFDRVKHDKLMSILTDIGLDDKDIRIINNLYCDQTAVIRVGDQLTEEVKIQRGVRQGCVLSPLLFNVYSEEIIKQALGDIDEGILINGKRLNNIRYADDTIIFADSMEGLQTLVERVAETSQLYGLDFNVKKTKYMVISKNQIPHEQLMINNQPITTVNSYTYLGTNLNDRWDHSTEIKQRIEKARIAFVKFAKIFKSRDLPLTTKIRLLRCYVFSILLYGVEAWTLTNATMKKLEAFEMWCYRRILRTSWMDRVTNAEVLRRLNKECEIILHVKQRKLEYLGHITRNENRYSLLLLILQGKVYGKRGPGRRRNSWLQNLRQWFSLTTTGLFRAAADKIRIAMLIANIRTG